MNQFIYNTLKKIAKCLIKFYTSLLILFARLFLTSRKGISNSIGTAILNLTGVKVDGPIFIDSGFRLLNPKKLKLGRNISLGHDNHIWSFNYVEIGSYTQTAKDLLIISGGHRNNDYAPLEHGQKVVIGAGCWIGARVTILGGTSIGYGSIIAAGSVVKGSYEPFSIIGGVPAKLIKKRMPSDIIVNPFGEYSINEIMK